MDIHSLRASVERINRRFKSNENRPRSERDRIYYPPIIQLFHINIQLFTDNTTAKGLSSLQNNNSMKTCNQFIRKYGTKGVGGTNISRYTDNPRPKILHTCVPNMKANHMKGFPSKKTVCDAVSEPKYSVSNKSSLLLDFSHGGLCHY